LEQWQLALGEDKASLVTTKRIRKLEREPARKEKALAEAAALLVLKKKGGPPLGCQAAGGEARCRVQTHWSFGAPSSAGENIPTREDGRHRNAGRATRSRRSLVPQLADDGIYLASESTMYRLQRRFELRGQARATAHGHVTRATTVHCAKAPNQVWSWDITYLPTPVRGRFLRLYLVLDVWSRRIVGWKIHERESDELAAEMIQNIYDEAKIDANRSRAPFR
jgi:hypothetical protein